MTQRLTKPQTWEDAYLISFYEVDAKNRIFLPGLWKYLQETAWNHANQLGIGYSDLARNDYFWVLSRLAIHMKEYPGWGEKIRVKTWLSGSSRLFALRDFSIVREDGEVIGGAKSAWVVLDVKSRKPQRIEPFLKDLNPLPDQHGAETRLDKLPAPSAPHREALFTVRYSDLDMHLHVNNSRYLEWILNSYSFEMNQTHHISTLEIHFLAESNCGDELSVLSEKQNDSVPTFLHTMVRKADGRELCRSRVRWKKVE
jgi:medium-chain acyl-[acyl-carrier-protein] hydrolase